MNQEDIIKLAQEAGFEIDCCSLEWHGRIKRFAALVAAAAKAEAREACAKLLESRKTGANDLMDAVRDMEAAAIRAMGNT